MNDTFHEARPDDQAIETPTSGEPATPSDADGADELTSLRQERDDLQDRLLRQAAEFDNFRKRKERERREVLEQAASDVLLDLLPIVDDMERALAATAASDDPVVRSHGEGLELIRQQCLDLLRRHDATPIEALGADFDPNVHEAVGQEVSDAHREGEIIEELRRGYMLKDRLLRAAMVRVATRG